MYVLKPDAKRNPRSRKKAWHEFERGTMQRAAQLERVLLGTLSDHGGSTSQKSSR